MIPSPGRSATPPRVCMKSGKCVWVSTSTGLGYLVKNKKRKVIRSSMTEGLHYKIGLKSCTSQVFQFVTCHRTGSILRANSTHGRFAVLAGAHTVHAASTTDLDHIRKNSMYHLLGQGVTMRASIRSRSLTEVCGWFQTKDFTCLTGHFAPDDQRDTTTGLHFIQ